MDRKPGPNDVPIKGTGGRYSTPPGNFIERMSRGRNHNRPPKKTASKKPLKE